ncbi:MAG: POT family proton-dependent oligopeptide transporter [Halioglobus sp.]|jgi:POT family proton-dependent oligopeptide transporter
MSSNISKGLNNSQTIEQMGKVLDHPSGLFVLFFTEMWERFSYYGMRALLVIFLIASLDEGGYGWDNKDALQMYALYTGLVYFTPLIGGVIADKLLGYRNSVIIGAFIMAAGHLFMALEIPIFFYMGLGALIIGNGLFKPNISSIVGKLYDDPDKKDGAYTIFYMGINAGAFLGIMLCGYLGEKVGWSYGFGLAMIFMIAGAVQFWLSGDLFGKIGTMADDDGIADIGIPDTLDAITQTAAVGNRRLFTWIGIASFVAAIIYFINPLIDTESILSTINTAVMPSVIVAAFVGIIGFIVTDPSLTTVEKDRVWVITIFTLFTVFFWWAFEQAGGSMTVFAAEYTERTLTGSGAMTFKVLDTILTIVPVAVITWVLIKLSKVTYKKIPASNIVLGVAFAAIWAIVIWKINREFSTDTTEVGASWFGILNSFFIITFAPLFSKFWNTGIIKSGPIKFALGLFLLAVGFAILAFGCMSIPIGAKTASVSMVWLIVAYLFHTLGELCLSPVGLSYVSKLAPVRLIGIMFGVFFLSNFLANWAGGMTGSYIDPIVEEKGMAFFFMIFAVVPASAAVVLFLLKGKLKKMMHGID